MQYKAIIGIIFIFVVLFTPPISIASEKNSSARTIPWDSTAPFIPTGLMVKDNEKPEEILMRAHQRDPRAMLLAVAGYAVGVAGFPPDPYLAATWAGYLAITGHQAEGSFAAIMIWAIHDDLPMPLGERLADCHMARESVYAPIFQKTGLLDMPKICSIMEELKSEDPNWKETFTPRVETLNDIKKAVGEGMALLRQLGDRPATREEQKHVVKLAKASSPDTLFFYAATTHDPAKALPD